MKETSFDVCMAWLKLGELQNRLSYDSRPVYIVRYPRCTPSTTLLIAILNTSEGNKTFHYVRGRWEFKFTTP